MTKYLKITALVLIALLLQTTLLPAYLVDPFQPNLLIILVVYLGLKLPHRLGPAAALSLGILQDCYSGLCFGLQAFSYLCIYLLLAEISDRLFTDNRLLLVIVVFLATVLNALLNLVMLIVFSVSQGIYASVLPAIIPQALVNALAASILFNLPLPAPEEAR
ncbi:rod shape-determining protein MreD [Geomesophilobacter sediminis]|uniref:Rod shape-determining protein MreD n=1 Tax=Geomesophilobacter sediminis TaxID=2798584 RepID=A0A8J7JK32_9BACT|nr:rod shape-determining protein MreD [Geomesophilobacter sediminis]MBJ6723530.1 rod shape-determining protein MreD [Geomesophilobacter sediminis]